MNSVVTLQKQVGKVILITVQVPATLSRLTNKLLTVVMGTNTSVQTDGGVPTEPQATKRYGYFTTVFQLPKTVFDAVRKWWMK